MVGALGTCDTAAMNDGPEPINSVYVATSLDGYIATDDGGVGWLEDLPNPDETDFGYGEFTSRIDALVMGRGTFDTVVGFGEWPYDMPVVVMSSSVTEPPEWAGQVEFSTAVPRDLVAELHARGWRRLYIDGGAVITSFLSEDLIDELIITTVPITLGSGIRLFGRLESADDVRQWELVSVDRWSNGFVQTHHRRLRS
jgi:dihydrofolate reductase